MSTAFLSIHICIMHKVKLSWHYLCDDDIVYRMTEHKLTKLNQESVNGTFIVRWLSK